MKWKMENEAEFMCSDINWIAINSFLPFFHYAMLSTLSPQKNSLKIILKH
jgi:hypothetical protein